MKHLAEPECKCGMGSKKWSSLINYLCFRHKCSTKELQVLFECLETRREIKHLKNDVLLMTKHLRPVNKNFIIRCHDITTQSCSVVPALGGYLGVSVCDFYLK